VQHRPSIATSWVPAIGWGLSFVEGASRLAAVTDGFNFTGAARSHSAKNLLMVEEPHVVVRYRANSKRRQAASMAYTGPVECGRGVEEQGGTMLVWLNTIGLILGMIGVFMIFKWGPPPPYRA
jgi:hypothetical protein